MYKAILEKRRGGEAYESLEELAQDTGSNTIALSRIISADDGLVKRGYIAARYIQNPGRRRILVTDSLEAVDPRDALQLVEDESCVAAMKALINGTSDN